MPINKKYRSYKTSPLIDACIDGDPLAWSEFIQRYNKLIHIAIKTRLDHYTGNYTEQDIQDIKQKLFLKLWQEKSLINVKGAFNIHYWISFVSANFATDHHRKMKHDVMNNPILLTEEKYSDTKPFCIEGLLASKNQDIIQNIDYNNLREHVENILDDLNPKEKIITKLHIFHGLKHRQIAIALQVPQGTISSIIKRAKEKIQKKMHEKP